MNRRRRRIVYIDNADRVSKKLWVLLKSCVFC